MFNINKLKVVLAVIYFLTITAVCVGQKGTIRGYVYNSESGQPIVYSNVYILGTDIGTNTDYNGFFNFSAVNPGSYTLVVAYIGFDSITAEIKLNAGSIVNKNFYLNESPISLGEVKISAHRQTLRNEVHISQLSVSAKQIKSLPSVGGDADIAQYLQVLPGVVSTGDQGGQIYIRGGSPVQNKIMLDGLNIYNPFHSLGFYSVFETELIRNVDVLTGGFGAEYGGRTSAIVDIKTREGDRKKMSGQVSISPFSGKALIEGPLSKFEAGKGSISFVLTSKRSLIEHTSKSIYKYAADVDSVGLPFSFNDSYGKLSIVSSGGSKFNLFGFNFSDEYNNPALASINWKNTGIGGNFHLVPNTSNMIVTGTVGVTKYKTAIDDAEEAERSSGINEFGANIDFTVFGDKNELNYGFELKSMTTDFNFTNPFGVPLAQNQNTTELAFYTKFRQKIRRLIIEPSFRVIYYASLSRISPEPRLGIKYNITDDLRIKGGAGLYTQNILGTSQDRDVVNLFSGFLTGPESIVRDPQGKIVDNKLQQSRHAIAGIEYDVNDDLQLNIESYIKDFPQLIVVNRNKLLASDADYSTEKGKAYGIEFSAKLDKTRYNLWVTYSYGFVKRDDGKQEYPTVFDRRHNANILATYNFDKKGNFTLSARWNLGSGFPFTQTQGFYNNLDFLGGVDSDYLTSNPDQVGIIFSNERNGGRLPYYHRLDVSLTKKFEFTKHAGLEIVASVTNAYNRDNIFYFDRIKYSRVNQLPMLPALSAKFYF